MLIVWIAVIVVILFLAGLVLGKQWTREETGKDLANDDVGKKELEQLPEKKRLTLAALTIPVIFFLVIILVYIIVLLAQFA